MQGKKLRQSYQELQKAVGQLDAQAFEVRQAMAANVEVLTAIVSLLGEESVTAEILRLRQERQDQQETEMGNGVKLLADARVLQPVEESTEDTLIVGADVGADSKTRRAQFEVRAIAADIRGKFVGKRVGDVVEHNNATLTVTEIYRVDKARAVEYQQEVAAVSKAKALTEATSATPE